MQWSWLKKPGGALKFPEIIIGIACIVLVVKVGYSYQHLPDLAFIAYGSSIIISSCIVLTNLFAPKQKLTPYLEIALNFAAGMFYFAMAIISLTFDEACKRDDACLLFERISGGLTVVNFTLYTLDAILLLEFLSFRKKPIDIIITVKPNVRR